MEMSPFIFGLYKLVKYAVYPLTWIVLILGFVVLLTILQISQRRLRWIRHLAISAFLLLVLLSTPIVAGTLVGLIEEQATPFDATSERRFDAIVVLGAGAGGKGTLRPADELSGASMERTICGADLFRQGVASRIVFSGGDASIFGEGPQEGVEMKRLALQLGVPEEAIIVEGRSRSTYENAREVKQMLVNGSILMVTSAHHVPRALGLFRKQGLNVTPYPCGYLVRDRFADGWGGDPFALIPQVEALLRSTLAINEFVGILVYRLSGKL